MHDGLKGWVEARSGYFDALGSVLHKIQALKDNNYVATQHQYTKSWQQRTEAKFGYFDVPNSTISSL